jgi:hypothetical protein
MTMASLLRLLLCTLVLVAALPMTARADDNEKAGVHFTRGKDYFDEGNYPAALVEFRRAYELVPNWKVLYNIGQVQFQLQDYAGAKATLERYLEDGGDEIPPDRRAVVRADIEKLAERVAEVDISVNIDGATVMVDDVDVGTSPLSGPVAVSAGRRKITASMAGRPPVSKSIDVAGGDQVRVELALETGDTPLPEPEPEVEDDEPSRIPWAPWGVTAGFGVGALVCGLLALDAASDLDDAKARQTDKEELDSIHDRLVGLSVATDILLGATVITAGVSLYLTISAFTSDDEDASVAVVLSPSSLSLRGSF